MICQHEPSSSAASECDTITQLAKNNAMQVTEGQLAELMKQSGMAMRVEDLPAFHWRQFTYSQLVEMIKSGLIVPGVLYDSDARHTVLSSREKTYTELLGNLMGAMPLCFLVGAILSRQWILLYGIPGFLIAAFVSNPWA